jgi:hypothetical protein
LNQKERLMFERLGNYGNAMDVLLVLDEEF